MGTSGLPPPKHGFEDLQTIHALISPPTDSNLAGTEFAFLGVPDTSIEKAKSFFLKFTPHTVLETTDYGQVITRSDNGPAYIYVNGLRVAEEPNFLFSYNITNPNKSITKALNRERTNVGRSAYRTESRRSCCKQQARKSQNSLQRILVATSAGRCMTK